MKFSTALLAAAAIAPAFAAPTVKRDGVDDETILQYALTLEHLENAFYSGALAKFDDAAFQKAGYKPAVRGRFTQIAAHEASHVQFLQKALGDKATQPCTYTFPYTDPKSFIALSAAIEGTGVSAYLGAAGFIQNKDYLTAAGSILTTEARHNAWVNSVGNMANPWSGAYDAPLSFNEVYSIAANFITKCPDSNPKLPVKAFPALTSTAKTFTAGKAITVKYDGMKSSGQFMAFMDSQGVQFAPIKDGSVTIPSDVMGTVYGVVTTASSGTVSDDNMVTGVLIIGTDYPSTNKM